MFGFRKRKHIHSRADPGIGWMIMDSDDLEYHGYVTLDRSEEIRRCVHRVADIISDMTVMLMKNSDNGDVRVRNGLSRKLDIEPNAVMTRKQFIYSIVTELMISGNAIVLPHISSSGKNGTFIDNLEPIPCGRYSFVQQGESYMIQIDGRLYNPDEVLHYVLNPCRSFPWRGGGYTDMILSTLKNIAQANTTKTGFLKSKWKPSVIIAVDSEGEEIADKEKRKKLLDSYSSDMEAGKPWMIPAGEISVEKIQPLTLRDLAIQESLTLDIQTVAACIGIPPFMVGAGTFNKDEYNNFIATTIMSIAKIIEQETTKKLIYFDGMYVKLNSRSLLQYSLTEKVQFVKEMVGGGLLNRNEGRNEFDYSPVDDDSMNKFTVLENYLEVKDLGKQKKLEQGGDDNE